MTCGLAIYQRLPNEGSDPREQQKASRAQRTSLGVCRRTFLFPRDPSITAARDCSHRCHWAFRNDSIRRALRCHLTALWSVPSPSILTEYHLFFRLCSRGQEYANEQNQTRTFPLRTSNVIFVTFTISRKKVPYNKIFPTCPQSFLLFLLPGSVQAFFSVSSFSHKEEAS